MLLPEKTFYSVLTVYLAKSVLFEAFSDPSSTYPYNLFIRGFTNQPCYMDGTTPQHTHTLTLTPPVLSSPNGSPIPSPSSEVHAVMPSHPRQVQISPPPTPYPALIKQNKVLRLLCSYITHTSIRTLVIEIVELVFLQEPRIFSSDVTSSSCIFLSLAQAGTWWGLNR